MMKKTIEEIAREDGRYHPNALKFVHDGLGHTIMKIRDAQDDPSAPRHVTGAELSKGLAQLAIEKWGRLGKMVFNHWSVRTTRDLGEIVYLMIRNDWMTAQENDIIEDFDDVFDFEQVFEKEFSFNSE